MTVRMMVAVVLMMLKIGRAALRRLLKRCYSRRNTSNSSRRSVSSFSTTPLSNRPLGPMYEQCESLADKLFPVNQEGRDDDLASIKIDIENPTASPLNVAGTFLWSLPRNFAKVSSSSSISPPCRALAARERAENTAYPKFAQLAKYDKQGARYDPHVDYDPNNADGPEGSRICERNLTAILYFNLGYETEAEGCLRVFLNPKQEEQEEEQEEDKEAKERQQQQEQKFLDIQPLPGRLVLFDSRRILHGVTPSLKRRWAMTVWS